MSEKRACCKFTLEQEQEIIKEYQNGDSTRKLSQKYNCSPSTIGNILKRNNLSARTLSEARRNFLNYTIDESCFEIIDNPDKAYWLGVMYSDGYISKATKYTNSFGLSVSEKDLEWVEKFKKFLKFFTKNDGKAKKIDQTS